MADGLRIQNDVAKLEKINDSVKKSAKCYTYEEEIKNTKRKWRISGQAAVL